MLNYFNFKYLSDNSVLLTNDFGEFVFLTPEEFVEVVSGELDICSDTYEVLRTRHFIIKEQEVYSSELFERIRQVKRYIFQATSLHIFVVTDTCNLGCIYCQARARRNVGDKMMSKETAVRAADIALQSPAKHMTFEFQGGEPLLNFDAIKAVVEYVEAAGESRQIGFTVVSNLSVLTDEMLDFLIMHNVSISTSLDGPSSLHDLNRPHLGSCSSHELLTQSLAKIRARGRSVGGIQTTTRQSLSFAKEIVHEYLDSGLTSIFIRPLTPLGFAQDSWDRVGYTPDEFLRFYREALQEIITINLGGTAFREGTATILLEKVLRARGLGYMDLRSPCGASFGQLAYYYDGSIYTCDEARMVAEGGDDAFRLGDVASSTYRDLVSCAPSRATCAASITESLPGCCDCVYQPFCGVCPVVTYACGGDLFPREPRNYRCGIYSGILDTIFGLLHEGDSSVVRVLESWLP